MCIRRGSSPVHWLLLHLGVLLAFACLFSLSVKQSSASAEKECVNVFYDRGPENARYWIGRAYAIFLQNLLGHFPEFQQVVSPIERYQKGDIEKCRATFYIGSYFENPLPKDFVADYLQTRRPVAWLGYSIWKLGSELEALFGYKYAGLTRLDKERTDEKGLPSFFRWIDYKGESFYKYAAWSRDDSKKFLAPFEQVRLTPSMPARSKVLAWARHSATGERIPYVLQTVSGRRFFIADVPFSFMHEADRYLVFSDLLFDILGVEPRRKEKLALVRVEDVHPMVALPDLFGITKALVQENIPFSVALIPFFSDPLGHFDREKQEFVPLHRSRALLDCLKGLPPNLVTFTWHGVTHQHGRDYNPLWAVTGADFEFWMTRSNAPVPEDSSAWLLNRLNDGLHSFERSGLPVPLVWQTPHYQASALDSVILARVFPWTIGRVIYFDYEAQGLPVMPPDGSLSMRSADSVNNSRRLAAFRDLVVRTRPEANWVGQLFPYEIYGDIYGQRVLPEDLGNSQPFLSDYVSKTRTAHEIVADAKRNRVLRDVWASFFYHPQLLRSRRGGGLGVYPGDPSDLRFIIGELKKLDYKFVDLKTFISRNSIPNRPEPIYREVW